MNKTDEIYVTMQGLEDMKKELEYLQKEKRPEVIEALKEARALGDLSENAEYDAARSEQAEVESKIANLSLMIENAKLITDADTDEVSIGNTVTVEYVDDNEKEDYTIVGSTEADPFENKISNESPIAQAIMGLKVGEVAKVSSPNGEYAVKVLEIK
ncbi:MAG: transcription elongation factor GreA [Bacilli bacterium]|nr:transcription elongation factor GreA [Bacilli bacterium]